MRPTEDDYNRIILEAISTGRPFTQRSLAGELGVALGLTNLLIRRLVAKGYVRMSGLGTRHIRYLMTTAGWEALGRMTRVSLENTVHLYTQTREQIRSGLLEVSRSCPATKGGKPVVFYGAGDVAEIAYVSLQTTDLRLVGVVDDHRRGRFFDMPIQPSDRLNAGDIAGTPYVRVVITSIRHASAIAARLDSRGVARAQVSFITTPVA